MPGIHTVISGSGVSDTLRDAGVTEVTHAGAFSSSVVLHQGKALLVVSSYDGYPWRTWENGTATVLFEGAIYNRSWEEVERVISGIARKLVQGADYRSTVRQFVTKSDGDFVVQIWDKEGERLLLFNDYLGRLPVFFSCGGGRCAVSRELKFVLRMLPRISLDRFGIVEFLMFEHCLENKTLFAGVSRLKPSQTLVVDASQATPLVEVGPSAELDCVLREPFSTPAASIAFFRDAFLEAVENRVRFLARARFDLVSDLSGGFDSRTVLGGLAKFTKDVTYCTIRWSHRDETETAKALFSALGCPGRHRTIEADHVYQAEAVAPLVYRTDGLVNYRSTLICYEDLEAMRAVTLRRAARFTGLGASDFLRKQPKPPRAGSLLDWIERGRYSAWVPLRETCRMVKVSPAEFYEGLRAELSVWPERTPEEQLKRFYFEYQHHLAYGAPEDRERFHFWSVPPMCSLDFMRAALSRFPVSWAGYGYYIRFMEALDPRLLLVPIAFTNIDIRSRRSIRRFDLKAFLQVAHPIAAQRYRILRTFLRPRRAPTPRAGLNVAVSTLDEIVAGCKPLFEKLLAGSTWLRDVFDEPTTHRFLSSSPRTAERVLTLCMFLTEVELHHEEKL
jgi:hypothetical protein